ncbi:MAG: HEPN domain-containing protein [Candidatus Bipolaricaulia bacterium]
MSDYDWETAKAMFRSRRYVYCIFMCHLAIEKALKGVFWEVKEQFPPKTHNLLFFVKELALPVPQELLDFIGKLNDASVVTRYPEDLQKVVKAYPRRVTQAYLNQTEEALQWLKAQLPR